MKQSVKRVRSALCNPRLVRAIVGFVGVGVLLYVAAIFWFGWGETTAALATLGLYPLLLGAVVSSSAYLWRFARWEYILKCLGYVVPRRSHLGIYLAGLALTTTPGKSGETFRSALLLQHGVRVPHSLAAFLVDRSSDVLGVCLLGACAAWAVGQPLAWAWVLAFVALVSASCALAYGLLHPRSTAWWWWLQQSVAWLPVAGGQATLESWASLWKPKRVVVYASLAWVAYGTQALVFAWFCQRADTGLPVARCILIFVQATLFGAASMLPGGLGAMEAALAFQLTEHQVDADVAVSLALAIRLATLWTGLAIGCLALLVATRQRPTQG